ncbi:MAG TPA: ATP-binding protein [Bryobacteraceae bacterium]|nr:ATP-binding protein [Bryobacteraceae bacterium]
MSAQPSVVFQQVVESVLDYAIYAMDPAGTIQMWNAGAEKLFGVSRSEAVGHNLSALYPSEEGPPVTDRDLRTAEQDGSAQFCRLVQRRGGGEFWSDTTVTALKDSTGVTTGFSVIARDATMQKRAAELLDRTSDELQRFAFVVSHDLQEPTRTIRSYSELLERRYKDKLEGDAREFLDFMVDAANRMSQLLRDLLAYSQAGRSDRTKPELTEALTVLQWALMNVDPLVKECKAKVNYGELPTVHVDQTQFATVLQHLLTNSLKFRGEAPPVIDVAAADEGGMWRFALTDNGIGIDPQFHERVFGVFKRLHGKDVPGTGIGLAICRKVIEAHGGRIWLESAPGRGTTVYFTLPRA